MLVVRQTRFDLPIGGTSRRKMSSTRVSRWDKSSTSRPDGSPERRVFHRNNAVWYSENNNDPCSPMTVERLPFTNRRVISEFLKSKRKTNIVSNGGENDRSGLETGLPFFIDKSPSEDITLLKKRCENMNESVILLDSPKSSSANKAQETENVDVVDLCSDSEDEQPNPPKRVKGKERKTELSKVVEEPKNDSPDIIILDDSEESVSRSKFGRQNGAKSKTHPISRGESSKLKRSKTNVGVSKTKSCSRTRKGDKTIFNIELGASSSCSSEYYSSRHPSSVDLHEKGIAPLVPLSSGINSCHTLAQMDPRTLDLSSGVGTNVFNPNGKVEQRGLRPIIIDGCNVAIAHGGHRRFSVRGLSICVEYFLRRGHTEVFALVPLHQRTKVPLHERDVLDSLQRDKHLVFTPSRFIDNRLIASYDDRYIVQYAAAVGGVIVSKDNYRDLLNENPAWRDTILNRLLIPTWVGDMLMFPVDPMGKKGPTLDEFLRFPNK